ncbi:hypothetical protein DS6A_26 [Mycobacterium phage DS6A]|uniref:Minor tail protein n=1 Tax=Mycobacterium phage DS6A TaxID=45764 RepID=G8I4D6_9CAUD|nr:hypothetical protein DS6A_26 [Mycobacterium phage DS6A]AER47580.1 hypothetical protein DS6A_26 [Mycobacterium phage DS6A]
MASIDYVAKHIKDPDAVLDYPLGWKDWLVPGDTIVNATATLAGGTAAIDQVEHTNDVVTVWLSGGVVGQKCEITVHIVTDQGREDDRTILVTVKQR